MYQEISVAEAKSLIDTQTIKILDARDELTYQTGHLPGATLLSKDNLEEMCNTLDIDDVLLIYCYYGNRSRLMAQVFTHHGFKQVYSLAGGFTAWQTTTAEAASS